MSNVIPLPIFSDRHGRLIREFQSMQTYLVGLRSHIDALPPDVRPNLQGHMMALENAVVGARDKLGI